MINSDVDSTTAATVIAGSASATDDDADLTVIPPNSAYVAVVAAMIRGGIQIASGLGFGWAALVKGDPSYAIAFAVVSLATLIWSGIQKIQAIRKRHTAAIISAQRSAQATVAAGKPVSIAVVDPKVS